MAVDVVALGELLIGFARDGTSDDGAPRFAARPGGAPANVLAMLAGLGKTTAMIGKVGGDHFGKLILDALGEVGVATHGVVSDPAANTTLVFVHTDATGERDFSFFRRPGADTLLRQGEVRAALLQSCRIFHFGSLSLTADPSRTTTRWAVQFARSAGAMISFNPNLRPPLWRDLDLARAEIRWGLTQADLAKLSDDELAFVTHEPSLREGVRSLRRAFPNLRLVLITRGADGASAYFDETVLQQPAFLTARTVDTTGAGDAFLGSALSSVLDVGAVGTESTGVARLDRLDATALEALLRQACAAGAAVTTRTGALCAMPAQAELHQVQWPGTLA